MYKCTKTFIIHNTSILYEKDRVIPSSEFNDNSLWGYRHNFKPYDEETSRNNARAITPVFTANKLS